jgi:hypothetical protein
MFAKASMLILAITVLCVGWAGAVVIDGVNDFLPGDLVDPDGGDTEHAPLDIGNVYAAHDAFGIYLGYEHDPDVWTGVQVGIAVMLPGTIGGTTDPWGHAICFQGACFPRYIAYMNLDSEWDEWCVWDGIDWVRTPDLLEWVVNTPFDEIAIPYELIGVDCTAPFTQVFFEIWVTQDGGTKGPLDLSYNDDLQLSTPEGTIWDIETPVCISCYHCIELYGPSANEGTTWGGIKNLYK